MNQVLPDDRVDQEATKAHVALREGDTLTARKHRDAAGRLLLDQAKSATRSTEKHLLMYLAATQYFLGGNYQQALKIVRRIEKRLLPQKHVESFTQFERDVNERSRPEYAHETRQHIFKYYQTHNFAVVLESLKVHPFIYTPSALASIRTVVCTELGDTMAAAVFLAQARRHGTPADHFFGMAFLILDKVQFLEYSQRQTAIEGLLRQFPHTSSFAATTIALNKLQRDDTAREPAEYYRKQVEYFRRGWELSEEPPTDPLICDTLALAAISAARAAHRIHDRSAATWAIDIARKLNFEWATIRELILLVTAEMEGRGAAVPSDRLSVPSEIQNRLLRRCHTNEQFLKTA